MGHIFISYRTKNQPLPDQMRELLQKNGYRTWMAPYDIPAGSRYAGVIHRAIRDADFVVLLLSREAQDSEWVAREIERAVNFHKTILAVCLDDEPLNDEFMMYLCNSQFERVYRIREDDPGIAKVLQRLGEKEKADPGSRSDLTGSAGYGPSAQPPDDRTPLWPSGKTRRKKRGIFSLNKLFGSTETWSPWKAYLLRRTEEDPAKALSAGISFTIGLQPDGTALFTGDPGDDEYDVGPWESLVMVSAGDAHVVGLRADGSAVAAGKNDHHQCDVGGWREIKAVSAGADHTVCLRRNGTVVATGKNDHGQCETGKWSDIVAVSAGDGHTVGLRADGTVAAVGRNERHQCETGDWRDIVSVSAGGAHTVGLRSNGTVASVGENGCGQCQTDSWREIVAVSAGWEHTVGLLADGTVVAVGSDSCGQCRVGDWRDILAVAAGAFHTVGLRADGTVVAVGRNVERQCAVRGWRLKTD